MKWIKASESDMADMQKKHWRDGVTHEPLTPAIAYNLFFKVKNGGHPIEYLDESSPSDNTQIRDGYSREDIENAIMFGFRQNDKNGGISLNDETEFINSLNKQP